MKKYRSHAKINLFLDIISKYKNDYHGIKSIFSEISLYDLIEYDLNESGKLNFIDRDGKLPDDNLLAKAGKVFSGNFKSLDFGIDFYIKKNIPIGGGLGGGSSNATSVLKILNKNNKTCFTKKKLKKMGKTLGADIPFFIDGGIQIVKGIGEKLKKINIKKMDLNILLVFPNTGISTKRAYELIDENGLYKNSRLYKKKYTNLIKSLKQNNYYGIINNLYNTFEEVIYKEYPELKKIYNEILISGADKALLSGSGSTILGFYSSRENMEKGLEKLLKNGRNAIITTPIFNSQTD